MPYEGRTTGPRKREAGYDKTKPFSIRLKQSVFDELQALLDDTGISMTWAIDTACRDFLNGRRAEQINEAFHKEPSQ